jgi:two-component system sensor histidine kinase KdpD
VAVAGPLAELAAPELLSSVAHDLRTPLAALVTSSEVLAEDFDVLDRQEIRGMVLSMHRRALWVQGLVENLLCAATIREGRFQIQPRPISMVELVAEIRSVVEPLLTQKGQWLQVSFRGPLPEVWGDGWRLGQVLMNLLTNASKFGEPNTPIDLAVSHRGGRLRVSVADRGPGIEEATAARLFRDFYRSASSVGSGREGVGLGLAIVKAIVEAHGGQVGGENRRGGGARFWFDLLTPPFMLRGPGG